MKLINVVGDSLSMVRPDEGITGNQLYWYQLQRLLGPEYYVINSSHRAYDSSGLRRGVEDEIAHFRAYAAIIHLGVVDCWPRLFSRREKQVLQLLEQARLAFVTRKIVSFASARRYELTRRRPRVYVPLERFRANIEEVLSRAWEVGAAEHVFLLSILEPTDTVLQRSHGLLANVRAYNGALKSIAEACRERVSYLNLNEHFRDKRIAPLLPDGHHISAQAHAELARLLQRELQALSARSPISTTASGPLMDTGS